MIYVVTRHCTECPFLTESEGVKICNASMPPKRPVGKEPAKAERPSWCVLRREKVIVSEGS